jgi:hypothetical protein
VKPCGTPGFERAGGAIAVLEKLQVSNLISLKTGQEGKGRRNFLPSHVRFVGKRAEECDAATLLNRVGDLEVERFPIALDRSENIEQFLRSFVSARSWHNFLQFGVVEIQ